jgi:Trk-type K+ transport system membrane component
VIGHKCLFWEYTNSYSVDINLLKLYQQITLIFIACLCNPITINTFVVFVRLNWFEKRFRHIITESRILRQNKIQSRTKSMDPQNMDSEKAMHGVYGRKINVMHQNEPPGSKTIDNSSIGDAAFEKVTTNVNDDESRPGRPDGANTDIAPETTFGRREITFADELERKKSEAIPNSERVLQQRSPEHHIAFVENQRNPKDTTSLRIPGPRDVERGERPQRVEDKDNVQREESIHSNEHSPRKTAEAPEKDTEQPKLMSGERNRLDRLHLPHLRHRRHVSSIEIRSRAQSISSFVSRTFSQARDDSDPLPYLSYAATIGRNSAFVDLTEEQREELGGIEYRSLKTLAWVLISYNVGWTIFGIVVFLPWILHSPQYAGIVHSDGMSTVWWGFFTPTSMFTDLGFTLTPDSMNSFNTSVMPMLLGSFLIVIGNTGFPCMLRLVIWIGSKVTPTGSRLWEEFRFLLDHPRRCFTLLFPRKATWWLFFVLVVLNGIDIIFFVLLDLHDSTVTSLPPAFQFLDGVFQAASTRTAGFSCVDLADLHPGIQVSYLIMMYISVFPIAISVRQTNVYEEKSLGIYHHNSPNSIDRVEHEEDDDPGSRSYLGSHLRRQLSFDLWYVFLGLFLITIIEGDRIADDTQPGFTIWTVLFEIVSAYGTVGLSLGYPNTNASFSAQFKSLSKLIIAAMMIRGRHRGLPYALDRAILLPGEGQMSDNVRRRSAHTTGDAAATEAAARGEGRKGKTMGFLKLVTGALSAGPINKNYKRS